VNEHSRHNVPEDTSTDEQPPQQHRLRDWLRRWLGGVSHQSNAVPDNPEQRSPAQRSPPNAAPHADAAQSAAAQTVPSELLDSELLAPLEQRLQAMQQVQQHMESTLTALHNDVTSQRDEFQGRLAGLEKSIGRAGREQLKANALAETQQATLNEALDLLHHAENERTQQVEQLTAQVDAARTAARLDIVQAILPALDSLDEAQRAGRELLTQPIAQPRSPGWFERAFGGPERIPDHSDVLREAMDSWLVGLTYVRQRLLDVLAAEDVTPIESVGQPFDPERHIVLDVVPASDSTPAGIVAGELRRGYLVGERVLRHAEVTVAKAEDDNT
jgi:molecular chaperone GrpE